MKKAVKYARARSFKGVDEDVERGGGFEGGDAGPLGSGRRAGGALLRGEKDSPEETWASSPLRAK